jgi:uncharacterized phage protein (TIGR02218 family)
MKKSQLKIFQHMDSAITTLATCWHIQLQNGVCLGFTDHDQDIKLDDNIYLASSGFSKSSIEINNSLAVDNLEIRAILDNRVIKEADLLKGLYDMAEVLVFKINYSEPSQGIIILHRGWIGEITIKNNKFFAEVRGIAQKTSADVGEVYSKTCRAEFGDTRCKVNIEQYTFEAQIEKVKSSSSFYCQLLERHGNSFAYGVGEFITGENRGLKFQVKESYHGNIKLIFPLPNTIKEGDKFTIIYGCDKRFETCSKKYNNFLNFRGEPHIPEL